MSDRLATYLHNHLAGARAAVELLETLRDQHAGDPLQDVASELLIEVDEDLEKLEKIVDCVGGDAGRLEAALAWLGEKVAPVRVRLAADLPLGTLEILEALALGVVGKLSLWRVLETLSTIDNRLPPVDFPKLIERAQAQYARLESQRIAAARRAFSE